MLLQTNSYIVPKDKRAEHARVLRRFRQTLLRLGCDHFEVYEQVGANWNTGESTGRFVQIMRFRDRRHQMSVQNAERSDPQAQQVVREFCELINFPYQQQQGLFAVGFYTSFLRMPSQRAQEVGGAEEAPALPSDGGQDDNAAPVPGPSIGLTQPIEERGPESIPPFSGELEEIQEEQDGGAEQGDQASEGGQGGQGEQGEAGDGLSMFGNQEESHA